MGSSPSAFSASMLSRINGRNPEADRISEAGRCFTGRLTEAMSIATFFSARAPSRTKPVRISFSFALVMATYRTRSSSPSASLVIFEATAFCRSVCLLLRSSGTTKLTPSPASVSVIKSPRTSRENGCLAPRPQTKQIGYSSPLLLWMVVRRTTSAFSSRTFASP